MKLSSPRTHIPSSAIVSFCPSSRIVDSAKTAAPARNTASIKRVRFEGPMFARTEALAGRSFAKMQERKQTSAYAECSRQGRALRAAAGEGDMRPGGWRQAPPLPTAPAP